MIMNLCDICGKSTESLRTLRSEYQANDIVDICPECLYEINAAFDKVFKAQRIQMIPFFRRIMQRMKTQKNATP